jgi:hypothetical protein
MNHYIAEIDQNPFGIVTSLHAQRTHMILFAFADHIISRSEDAWLGD